MTNFESLSCQNCFEGFSQDEKIINATGEAYHAHCFV